MHIHILGICGTFMAGLAILAKQLGHTVTGSDAHVYPPMSTQLQEQAITLYQGYLPEHLQLKPDLVIVGNALSRGNPLVEALLNSPIPYISGPQWLSEQVLPQRWVLAVAGTHGKTTTSSLLAWILTYAGLDPGFLIGGLPNNFGVSARLGATPFFVIEADEYDSAFFDKRPKFMHYRPRTLIMNNLEYDHADIFASLAEIQTQFHYLVRTVPSEGLVVCPKNDANLAVALAKGQWTPIAYTHTPATWQAVALQPDCRHFAVYFQQKLQGEATWPLLGEHNMSNALHAIVAAQHVGVPVPIALAALANFQGVKRRLEHKDTIAGIHLYDDFAHHPTAIASTLAGLRQHVGTARIIAVAEAASNTMKLGIHQDTLAAAFAFADQVFFAQPSQWDIAPVAAQLGAKAQVIATVEQLATQLAAAAQPGDHIVMMSNGSFQGLSAKLVQALTTREV